MADDNFPAPTLRCPCGTQWESRHLQKTPREVLCEKCGRVWRQWRDANVVGNVLVERSLRPRRLLAP